MPRGETYRDVHVNRPLSNFSLAFFQDTSQFVSPRFFNVMPVMNQSDTYTTYPQGYFNRLHHTARAEEGRARTIQYKTKEDTYSCGDDALRIFISDKKRKNADAQRNLDLEATEAVMNALMIRKEKDFTDKFLKNATAPWTTKVDGDWSGTTNDPVSQVLAQKVNMAEATGKEPNRGIISYDLYVHLRERADILERVQYGASNTDPALVSVRAIAQLFELDDLLIMKSVQNVAVDGIEDPVTGLPPVSNEFMASEFFFMAHVPAGAGLFTATAGLTFAWNNYISHGLSAGPAIRRYRVDPSVKGEYIEAELSIDQKMVSPDLGMLFYDMLTP